MTEHCLSLSHVHSWAGCDSTLLYFGTAAQAPPPGRNWDHKTAAPVRRDAHPQWRRGGGAQCSPAWGSLEKM